MVTFLVLPAITRGELGPNSIRAFKVSERRFSWHARIAILIVRLTGIHMLARFRVVGPVPLGWICGGCYVMLARKVLFALLLVEPIIVRR